VVTARAQPGYFLTAFLAPERSARRLQCDATRLLGLVLGLSAHDLLRTAAVPTTRAGDTAALAPAQLSRRADPPASPVLAGSREGTPLPIARPAPAPRARASSPERGDAQLERLIEKNGLQGQRALVESAVPPGPVRTAMVNLVLPSTFQSAVGTEEAHRMYDEVRELEAQPAAAGEAIVATLESLPGELMQARQSLVTFLRQLNLPLERRVELLQRVLDRPLPEPNGDSEDQRIHAGRLDDADARQACRGGRPGGRCRRRDGHALGERIPSAVGRRAPRAA